MQPQYKRIALIVAAATSTTLTWWASKAWLTTAHPFTELGMMVVPALAIILTAAVVCMAWVLLEGPWERVAAILASWASFIIFWRPDIWYVSALPLFVLFWYAGSRRVRHDVKERRVLRIRSCLDHGMRLVLLGIFLMISLGFYLLPENRTTDLNTVSTGVQKSLDAAYQNSVVQSQLAELPSAAQAQVRRDLAAQADSLVRKWLGPLAPYLPPLLAFVLFLSLWSVSFLFREAGLTVASLMFWGLKRTGFITVSEEQTKAEVIKL